LRDEHHFAAGGEQCPVCLDAIARVRVVGLLVALSLIVHH
jgi:hypothetical protein